MMCDVATRSRMRMTPKALKRLQSSRVGGASIANEVTVVGRDIPIAMEGILYKRERNIPTRFRDNGKISSSHGIPQQNPYNRVR